MKKLNLANLPTPIMKLEKLSKKYNKNIYIKRDDYTGTEVSGNKVRKLEYVIKDALDNGADTIITSGGIQSNHCRATAGVCAKLGLECHVLLRGEENQDNIEGNLFLDYILGARVHLANEEEFEAGAVNKLAESLRDEGKNIYIIPIGASDAVGSHGYMEAYREIKSQEEAMGIEFDTIALTVGSGGTYAGLWYENMVSGSGKNILGFSVSDSKDKFKEDVIEIVNNIGEGIKDFSTIEINDDYVGEGYSIASEEEIKFHVDIAMEEGVIFDPCYTGKAFRGLISEIEGGNLKNSKDILFIHTGGLQGWKKEERDIAIRYAKEKVR